jgi:hypothetical protein
MWRPAVGVLGMLACCCSLAAEQADGPAPTLRLTANAAVLFGSPEEVLIRVLLANDGPKCHPVVVNAST